MGVNIPDGNSPRVNFPRSIYNKVKIILILIRPSAQSFNRSFIKRQTSGTSSDNEWQRLVQRVTMNGNDWQRMTTSGTTSYNKWQQMTMSDSEWQQVVQRMKTAHYTSKSGCLPFFLLQKETHFFKGYYGWYYSG